MTLLLARPIAALALLCTVLQTTPAQAAEASAVQPKTAQAAAKPDTKSAPAKQARDSQAKGLALAKETVQRISDAQLQVADRVLTGDASCEFSQTVAVTPVSGQPAHFHVAYKKATYTMVPEETTTGAVRLEDKKAGMLWLQIPSKSMLMNTKIGQRVVDDCTHSEQRAAMAAVEAAARAASAPEAAARAASAPDAAASAPVAGASAAKN